MVHWSYCQANLMQLFVCMMCIVVAFLMRNQVLILQLILVFSEALLLVNKTFIFDTWVIVLIRCEALETCEPDKTTGAASLEPHSIKLFITQIYHSSLQISPQKMFGWTQLIFYSLTILHAVNSNSNM